MIERISAAVEALNDGDPGPFASLFAADAEWRGVSHDFLWVEVRTFLTRPRRGP